MSRGDYMGFMDTLKGIFKTHQNKEDAKIIKNNEPEKPKGFGYKCSWLAIKTEDIDKIIRVLDLKNVYISNWTNGLSAAHNFEKEVFISPQLGEWTLVIGNSLPSAEEDTSKDIVITMLKSLSKEFKEVQYFSTHRVVEYHAWAKAIDGEIKRAYCYIGEIAITRWNIGKKTEDEIELGFDFFDENLPEAIEDSYWERDDLTYPYEETVMQISKRWSIDTSFENSTYEKGLGKIGKID